MTIKISKIQVSSSDFFDASESLVHAFVNLVQRFFLASPKFCFLLMKEIQEWSTLTIFSSCDAAWLHVFGSQNVSWNVLFTGEKCVESPAKIVRMSLIMCFDNADTE